MTASLLPVGGGRAGAVCAGCGAALVSDQRYCLTCGQPVSPVRLAFLDVLQDGAGGRQGQGSVSPATIEMGAGGYAPVSAEGPGGWLRRYSGLLGLLSVLVLCLLVGLLVGHWSTQKGSASPQVVKVEGLSGLATRGGTSNAGAAQSTTATRSAAAKAKEEAEAAKEAAEETKAEKAPPPKPVKVSPSKLDKLSKTTGKKHQEELNALGAQPIETG
jgi:hypothetical protein